MIIVKCLIEHNIKKHNFFVKKIKNYKPNAKIL